MMRVRRTATIRSPRWPVAVVTAGAALLAGCSGDDGGAAEPYASPRSDASVSAPAPAPEASEASAVPVAAPDLLAPETVATGITTPWGLAFLPDGNALVSERDTGKVLRVSPGGGRPREVYQVPGVEAAGEGGLLGLAVAADHPRTGWVYAYLTAADDNRVVRFKLQGGGRPEVIVDGIGKNTFHNGGRIAFGPDGMLYVGTGDAGDTSTSQDADDTNGKILRVTPEGRPAPGNPKAGSPVWSLGHRNVQGLAWDASGRMFATEFGQNRLDEVNVIKPGGNYGWPEVEGTGGGSRYVDPIVTWRTSDASPSGAAVAGDTLYVAALRGQRLWAVPTGGGDPKAHFGQRYGRLRTVATAPDGALWLTTSNTDGRGGERDGDDRILRFPAR
jgi:glucose/arabinose dehydrogenase